MSTGTATHRTRPGGAARPRRGAAARRRALRRRLGLLLAVAVAAAGIVLAIAPWADQAVQEVTLPLRHDDIIRQQAREKDLDPALIAGVILTESHFRDQTSHAGAKGLMQLMPETADNIAYGSWYLRHLLDKYDGRVALALAAYNAGQGNVDEWLADVGARGEQFNAADHIPFPETRDYVKKVLAA